MNQRIRIVVRLSVLAAAVLGVCGGCQTQVYNPWAFQEPPARAMDDDAEDATNGPPVVAVATFGDPEVPQLNWPVGVGMSEAVRRALRNETEYKVPREPVNLSKGIPDHVDFVIAGRVTDFHHTNELPKDISRWGIFRRRSEAVVAIEWKVVDGRTHRAIAMDHTYGTADASRKITVKEMYSGLDFSAYLFWNSPLGKAGHLCVDRMIDKVEELLPTRMGDPVIVRRHGDRKVYVEGGWTWGLTEGQQYYIAVPEEGQAAPRPLYDPDTGRPLMLRIGTVRKDKSDAWLMGKAPPTVSLTGATLSREPPPALEDLVGRQFLASDGGGQ